MGLLKTTFIGALVAGNTVAAVGSFEAVNKMHADPDTTAVEIGQEILYRPFDNFSRASLGEYSEIDIKRDFADRIVSSKPIVGIDAKISNFIGNVVNREEKTWQENPFTQIMPQAVGLITTMPGSYIGSLAGAATGAAGLHLEND